MVDETGKSDGDWDANFFPFFDFSILGILGDIQVRDGPTRRFAVGESDRTGIKVFVAHTRDAGESTLVSRVFFLCQKLKCVNLENQLTLTMISFDHTADGRDVGCRDQGLGFTAEEQDLGLRDEDPRCGCDRVSVPSRLGVSRSIPSADGSSAGDC